MKRVLVLLACLIAACTGTLESPVGPSGEPLGTDETRSNGTGNDGDGTLDGMRAPLCASGERDKSGPRLLRRLTKGELEATVRAVFGFDEATFRASDLPPDPAAPNGMTNQADLLQVGDSVAEKALSTAERVADLVVSDAHYTRIVPCATNVSDACAATFLDTIGKRLYRRPLSDAERTRYLALRDTVASEGGEFRDWIRWATAAMLTSPHVLYRSELGEKSADGRYALTGYERATALAFTFAGAPPDDALLEAAGRGELDTKQGLEAAVKALVLDAEGAPRPAFRALFRRFVSQWLGLSALENRDKDTTVFPTWTPEVRAAMREEIDRFVEHVIFEEKGGIAELLTAPYTLLNRTLRDFYGYGSAAGDDFEQTTRPEGWGVGLLAQGAILALKSTNRDTSPTQRGHLVRDRILCQHVPPPPPVVAPLPAPSAADTTRERYEDLHAANAACAGCHRLMDPIGFTFEHLDATGRFRSQENGFDIDDSGAIMAMTQGETDVEVVGPTALADELVGRENASACFNAFFASYSFGFDQEDTTCLVSSTSEALAKGDMTLLDALLAIASAPHFTTRTDG